MWPFDDLIGGGSASSGLPGMPNPQQDFGIAGSGLSAGGAGLTGAGNFVSGLPGGQIPGQLLQGFGGALSGAGSFLGGMFGGGGGNQGSYIGGPDYSYTGPNPYWYDQARYNKTGGAEGAPYLQYGVQETAPRGFTGQNAPGYTPPFTPHYPVLQNPTQGGGPNLHLKSPEHPWAAPIWTGGFGTGWLGSHFGTPAPAQGQSGMTTQGTYQAGVTPPPNPMAGK